MTANLMIWLLLAGDDKQSPSSTFSLLTGIASILWPLIAFFVLWKLWPVLKPVIESRSFTVEVWGVKLSVEDATKKLQNQIDDLQNEFLKLKGGTSLPSQTAVVPNETRDARILWVDDHPENNAFEAAKLRKDGFLIDQILSTREALEELASRKYQLVISDMGRSEEGGERSDAGLQLLVKVREKGILVPFVIFCSQVAADRYRLRAIKSGALGITSSPLELFELVQRICKKQIG